MTQETNAEWQRDHTTLADGGSLYAETNLKNFIVEPWNAVSSLTFLIPALFWLIKIKARIKDYKFTAFCIPFLILGGLGSTFFHAFRSSSLLLAMDVLPILILTLAVSAYFWNKVLNNWILSIGVMLTGFGLRYYAVSSGMFSHHTAMNISYFISGLIIFLPAILIQLKTNYFKIKSLGLAAVFLTLALLFREMDTWVLPLSMGTHFLWHISCAVGAYYLAEYLYHIKDVKISFKTVEAILEEVEQVEEENELQAEPQRVNL